MWAGLFKNRTLGIFQNDFFLPPPVRSMGGFFSDILCENLVGLQEVKLTKVWWLPKTVLLFLEFLFLRLVNTEPPEICQLHFRISYPSTSSHRRFCYWASVSVSSDSLYRPVSFSNFEGLYFPCNLNSLMDAGRIVDFQFVQHFFFIWVWE